jgi:iron complex transport system substrate-binding protein
MKKLFIFLVIFLHVTFAESKTITDMFGRQVEIPPTVRSVVTAGGTPAVNAFLFALGSGDKITNGLPKTINGKSWEFQTIFAPKLSSLPTVSNGGPQWDINIESLHLVAHDVVFVVNEHSAESLAKRNFCVIGLNWTNPDSIKHTITLLGDILGVQDRALAYNHYYDDTLTFVSNKVGNPKQKPKALYLRHTNLSLPMVSTATWMIENAGGINVAKEIKDHMIVSIEQILEWNPDVLFVWNSNEVNAVYNDKRLENLNAVKTKKIFAVPMGAHVWTHYTPEQPLAVLWAAEKFYPERFKDIAINQEIVAFYKKFFGVELSELQLNQLLNP